MKRDNIGRFVKGHKGFIGNKNGMWKGNKVGYSAVHDWINSRYTKFNCEQCNSQENLQWANISKRYKRLRRDWKVLCSKCHKNFDSQDIIFFRNKKGQFSKVISRLKLIKLEGGIN